MRKFAIVATALAILGVVPACSTMNSELHANCKVTNKDVLQQVRGDKHSTSTHFERRLNTTCGTFVVDDNLVGGFDSYDTWTSLEVGKVYDITTGGYRNGFFDSFPSVTKVTPK